MVEVLEQQLRDFFSLKSLDDPIEFSHAARKTQAEGAGEPAAVRLAVSGPGVWLRELKPTVAYSRQARRQRCPASQHYAVRPRKRGTWRGFWRRSGVRFVVVEPIPGSKIDGACFWLGAEPVVALSLRLDRIDNFLVRAAARNRARYSRART